MPRGASIPVPPPQTTILGEALNVRQGGLLATSFNGLVRTGSIIQDAWLRSRPGLTPLGTTTIGEPVLGSIGVRDSSDGYNLLIGTPTKWYLYNNATNTWTDITGTALNGAKTMPVTFAFWALGNNLLVIGVNDADVPRQFLLGGTAFTTITTAPIARSVCVAANRAVYARTLEAGVRYSNRVRWSAAGDQTTNPSGAKTDVDGTADQLVAVRTFGRVQAALYGDASQRLMTARTNASDANAWGVEIIDTQPGPIGPAAVDQGPSGTQVYLGQDGNLYSFNGVRATVLAWTSLQIQGRLAQNSRFYTCLKYLPLDQELRVLVPLDSDVIPTHEIVYSYKTGGFYLQQYGVPLTTLGLFIGEMETVTTALPDVPTTSLPDVPTNFLGVSTLGNFPLAGSASKVYYLNGGSDDGTAITTLAEFLLPIRDGEEYEFDGVEAQFQPPGASVTVTFSVKVGPTFDNLTTTTLGSGDVNSTGGLLLLPTAAAPTPAPTTTAFRGRVVVVRMTWAATVVLNLRHLELFAWTRKLTTPT